MTRAWASSELLSGRTLPTHRQVGGAELPMCRSHSPGKLQHCRWLSLHSKWHLGFAPASSSSGRRWAKLRAAQCHVWLGSPGPCPPRGPVVPVVKAQSPEDQQHSDMWEQPGSLRTRGGDTGVAPAPLPTCTQCVRCWPCRSFPTLLNPAQPCHQPPRPVSWGGPSQRGLRPECQLPCLRKSLGADVQGGVRHIGTSRVRWSCGGGAGLGRPGQASQPSAHAPLMVMGHRGTHAPGTTCALQGPHNLTLLRTLQQPPQPGPRCPMHRPPQGLPPHIPRASAPATGGPSPLPAALAPDPAVAMPSAHRGGPRAPAVPSRVLLEQAA